MTDEPNPDPTSERPGEAPAGRDADRVDDDDFDTEETELVAYLDGELDAAAARRVEERLSQDPATRAKAEVLKKTYDLLDYLPRPEPSPTFASRTLDRIPAASGRLSDAAVPNGTPASPSSAASGNPLRMTPSGSAPFTVASGSNFVPVLPPRAGQWGRWLIGGAFVLAAALGLGYFGHAAVRTYLFPLQESASISLEESRLVENLPLYVGVDDFEFLVRLSDSDEFSEDPSMHAYRAPVPPDIAQAASEQPWGKDLALAKAFKALPAARQDQLRELDHRLYEQPPGEQAKLFRVLESYAVWLHGLEDSERKAVLGASSPATRLAKIRDIREHQWQTHLPAELRKQLSATTDDAKKADLIQKWKADEIERRRSWLLARKNWETIRVGRTPWPFDNETLKKEVEEYVRTVLKMDGSSNGRLTTTEAEQLREAHDYAEKNASWLWYGSDLFRLAAKYEMLPEPVGKMYLRVEDLPKIKKIGERKNLKDLQSRWPEFALAVAEDAARAKVALPVSLGPCKPGEFREPIEAFLVKTLDPKLTSVERDELKKLEGKWPEYPRKMIDLAKKHDMPVPGITLPGSPKQWENTYQAPRGGLRPGS